MIQVRVKNYTIIDDVVQVRVKNDKVFDDVFQMRVETTLLLITSDETPVGYVTVP